MTALITGVVGSIGLHARAEIMRRGATVVGIDNVNPYCLVQLLRSNFTVIDDVTAGVPAALGNLPPDDGPSKPWGGVSALRKVLSYRKTGPTWHASPSVPSVYRDDRRTLHPKCASGNGVEWP